MPVKTQDTESAKPYETGRYTTYIHEGQKMVMSALSGHANLSESQLVRMSVDGFFIGMGIYGDAERLEPPVEKSYLQMLVAKNVNPLEVARVQSVSRRKIRVSGDLFQRHLDYLSALACTSGRPISGMICEALDTLFVPLGAYSSPMEPPVEKDYYLGSLRRKGIDPEMLKSMSREELNDLH